MTSISCKSYEELGSTASPTAVVVELRLHATINTKVKLTGTVERTWKTPCVAMMSNSYQFYVIRHK